MPRRKKIKLKINDTETLTYLLQETYNDACTQQIDAQKAINELVNSAKPEDINDLAAIAREKANLLKIKDSAIKIKLELGKLQSDIIKYNNVKESNNNNELTPPSIEDLKKIREMLKNEQEINTEEYEF